MASFVQASRQALFSLTSHALEQHWLIRQSTSCPIRRNVSQCLHDNQSISVIFNRKAGARVAHVASSLSFLAMRVIDTGRACSFRNSRPMSSCFAFLYHTALFSVKYSSVTPRLTQSISRSCEVVDARPFPKVEQAKIPHQFLPGHFTLSSTFPRHQS
jgi:hypothetical protein